MNTDYMTPNELAHELWSHMPEHEYEANRKFLKEVFRMLKVGGIWGWPETQRIFKKTSDKHFMEEEG